MNILSDRQPIPRRTFLKGAGISLALPWLDAMRVRAGSTPAAPPRRAVFCFYGLGLNGRDFTPADTGPNYTMTPILRPLTELKRDFTVISGLRLTHSGGHVGDRTFLTGTNTRSAGARLRISCDQELAQAVGRPARFPSLTLGIKRGTGFGGYYDQTLSWSPAVRPSIRESAAHSVRSALPPRYAGHARPAQAGSSAGPASSIRYEWSTPPRGSLGADDRRAG